MKPEMKMTMRKNIFHYVLVIAIFILLFPINAFTYSQITFAPRYHLTFGGKDNIKDTVPDLKKGDIEIEPGFGIGVALLFNIDKRPFSILSDLYTNDATLSYQPMHEDLALVKETISTERFNVKLQTPLFRSGGEGSVSLLLGGYYKYSEIPTAILCHDINDAGASLNVENFDLTSAKGVGLSSTLVYQKSNETGWLFNLGLLVDFGAAYIDMPEPFDTDSAWSERASGAVFTNFGKEWDLVTWSGGLTIGYQGTMETQDLPGDIKQKEVDGILYYIENATILNHELVFQLFLRF